MVRWRRITKAPITTIAIASAVIPDLDIVITSDRAMTPAPAAASSSPLASREENHTRRSRQSGFTPRIARATPPQSRPKVSGRAISIQPAT